MLVPPVFRFCLMLDIKPHQVSTLLSCCTEDFGWKQKAAFRLFLVFLFTHAFGLRQPDKAPEAEKDLNRFPLKIIVKTNEKSPRVLQTTLCVPAYLLNKNKFAQQSSLCVHLWLQSYIKYVNITKLSSPYVALFLSKIKYLWISLTNILN